MKLYNVLVLLHGEMNNQVRKEMVTAAEIQILRGIHVGNNDAVKDIKHVANVDRSDANERRRLALSYGGDTFALDGEVPVDGIALVNRYFPPGVPLPQEIITDENGNVQQAVEAAEVIEYLHPMETAARMTAGETIVTVVDEPAPVGAALSGEDDPFADEGVQDLKVEPPRRSPLRSGTRTVSA